MVIENKLITAKLLSTHKIVEVFEMYFTKIYYFKCVLTKKGMIKKLIRELIRESLGENAKCSI